MRRIHLFLLLILLLFLPGCGSQPYEESQFTDPLFREGLLCVTRLDASGSLFGYVNKKGEWAIQPQFLTARAFQDGVAVASSPFTRRYGLIDTQGNWLVEPEYDAIDHPNQGVFSALRDHHYGLVDLKGNVVADFTYLSLEPNDLGYAFLTEERSYGQLDAQGRVLLEGLTQNPHFSEGLAAMRQNEEESLYGYMDAQGNWAITPQFDLALDFSGGVAVVGMHTGDSSTPFRFGLIDKTGAFVAEPIYEAIETNRNGILPAQRDGKWGYIDTQGKTVLPFRYSWVNYFSEGLACVEENGQFSYVDIHGKPAIEGLPIRGGFFSHGRTMLYDSQNGAMLYDRRGRTMLDEPLFYCSGYYADGYAVFQTEKNGGVGVMDAQGVVILDPGFTRIQAY